MLENQTLQKLVRQPLTWIICAAVLAGGILTTVLLRDASLTDTSPPQPVITSSGLILNTPTPTPTASPTSSSTLAPTTDAVAAGDQAYAAGEYQQATDYYQIALAANPAQPGVWVKSGNALREVGNNDAALAAYQEARTYDKTYGDAYLNAAALFWKKDDQPAAIDVLKLGIAAGATRGSDLEETLSVYEALQK